MGLYVHDVGPCHFPEKTPDIPHCQSIMACTLEPGMVTSNEPGIYFIRQLVDNHKADPEKSGYFDFDKIEEYFCVGGVRIEEDVIITEDGCETYSKVPRTVEEIEAFMAK
jgi:Xaa-Pro dipeptidase